MAKNRVRVAVSASGTGPLQLAAPISGHKAFAGSVANGEQVPYVIELGTAWEAGVGTYDAAANTLTRQREDSSTGQLLDVTGNATVMISETAAWIEQMRGVDYNSLADLGTAENDDVISIQRGSEPPKKLTLQAFKNYLNSGTAPVVTVTFSPTTPLQLTQNAAFSRQFVGAGGTGPYTFTITAGALPTGMSLVNGLLSGTPSSSGTYNFSIRAADSNNIQSSAINFSGSIAAQAAVRTPTGIVAGVNLAGGEFGHDYVDRAYGLPGTDALYPSNQTLQNWKDAGLPGARIPLGWERLQAEAGGPLNALHMAEVDRIVQWARDNQPFRLTLDLHTYFRRIVGTTMYVIKTAGPVTPTHFAQFWGLMAARYAGYTNAANWLEFDLNNEPYKLNDLAAGVAHPEKGYFADRTIVTDEMIRDAYNLAIVQIRNAGFTGWVQIEPNDYAGARHLSTEGSEAQATAKRNFWLNGIVDSLNKWRLHVHQYSDPSYSGNTALALQTEIGLRSRDLVMPLINACRTAGRTIVFGELGGLATNAWDEELTALLQLFRDNSDVVDQFYWWAAGEYWPNDYGYLLGKWSEGAGGLQRQAEWVLQHAYLEYVRPINTPSLSSNSFSQGAAKTVRGMAILANDVMSVTTLPAGFTFDAAAKTITYDGSASAGGNVTVTYSNPARAGSPKSATINLTVEAIASTNPYPGVVVGGTVVGLDADFTTNRFTGPPTLDSLGELFSRPGGLTIDSSGLLMNDNIDVSAALMAFMAVNEGTYIVEVEGTSSAWGKAIMGGFIMRTDTPDNGKAAFHVSHGPPTYQSTKRIALNAIPGGRVRLAESWKKDGVAGTRVVGSVDGVTRWNAISDDAANMKTVDQMAGKLGSWGSGDAMYDAVATPNPRLRRLVFIPGPQLTQAQLETYTTLTYNPPA